MRSKLQAVYQATGVEGCEDPSTSVCTVEVQASSIASVSLASEVRKCVSVTGINSGGTQPHGPVIALECVCNSVLGWRCRELFLCLFLFWDDHGYGGRLEEG